MRSWDKFCWIAVGGFFSCLLTLGGQVRAQDDGPPASEAGPPTPDEVIQAVRIHNRLRSARRGPGFPAPCIGTSGDALREGPGNTLGSFSPGMMIYSVPDNTALFGDHRALTVQANERFAELTRAGFFIKQRSARLNSAGKKVSTTTYELTHQGWLHGHANCFPVSEGDADISIVGTKQVEPGRQGVPGYEITYKLNRTAISPWAMDPDRSNETRRHVESMKEMTLDLRLYRGKKGWLPESLTGPLVQASDPVLDRSLLELVPPLDASAIKSEIERLNHAACLTFPSKAGDEAVELDTGTAGRMQASYDEGTQFLAEPPLHKLWRARLDGLVRAGLFHARKLPPDSAKNRPAGIVYTLADEYLPFLEKTRSRRGCLSLGKARIDAVSIPDVVSLYLRNGEGKPYKTEIAISALARIDEDAWSRRVDLSAAPDVAAILREGYRVDARLEVIDGAWRLAAGEMQTDRMWHQALRVPKPPQASIVDETPKAGRGAEVHIVSIYRADARRVEVKVKRKHKPIFLILSSEQETKWYVPRQPGVKISTVVLMGKGSVEFDKNGPVVTKVFNRLPYEIKRLSPPLVQGWIGPAQIERLFGRRPDSWRMAHKGIRFVIDNNKLIGEVPQVPDPAKTAAADLERAVRAGVLRRATLDDAEQWINALKRKYALQNRAAPDIPADLYNAYVVLKRFAYPEGLTGGERATFYVPKGVPEPSGDYGHSKIHDMNSVMLECRGDTECGKNIMNGSLGAGANQTIYDLGSGDKIIFNNTRGSHMTPPTPGVTSASSQAAPSAAPAGASTGASAAASYGSRGLLTAAGSSKGTSRADRNHENSPSADALTGGEAALRQAVALHVVGIYEGPRHYGGPVDNPSDSIVDVYVRSNGKPVILVLSSYHSVTWNLIPTRGTVIKEVVLTGYKRSLLNGIDERTVKVSRMDLGMAHDNEQLSMLIPKVKQYTGALINSIKTQYKGKEFFLGL